MQMFQRVIGVCVVALAGLSGLVGAEPYEVTGGYGYEGYESPVLEHVTTGGVVTYTVSSPDFVAFRGVDWDRANQRVVFMAIETGEARIASVDESLDPASLVVIRSGLGVGASKIDVDPATGRIYWWENGQILSANSNGSGLPVLEASNVPEPLAMEIDAGRGVYVITDPTDPTSLGIGQLGDLGGPSYVPMVSAGGANAFIGDVCIDPVSGDFVWTESFFHALTGYAKMIFRSGNDGLDPEMIFGSGTPTPVDEWYYGVGVIDDQVGVIRAPGIFGTTPPKLVRIDLTTGLSSEIDSGNYYNLEIEYSVDPIIGHPENVIVDAGETGTLSVVPSDPGSSFEWLRNGVAVVDDGRVSGSDSEMLVVLDSMSSDTDTYRCVVTDGAGVIQESDIAVFAVRGSGEAACVVDLNDDQSLNFLDISLFLQLYGAGCP